MTDGRRTLSRTGLAPRIPTASIGEHPGGMVPPMTSRRGLLSLVAAAAMLCACGGQGAESASATGSPTRSTKMVQRTPDKAAATTKPEALADLVSFTSPSGNVGCYLDPTTVRCDISERDWSPPPRPPTANSTMGRNRPRGWRDASLRLRG